MKRLTIDTPTGQFTLTEDGGTLIAAGWGGHGEDHSDVLDAGMTQLGEYFAGSRRAFDLPLAPRVSAAQARFLGALLEIPFGETRTYGALGRDLGISAQAAGQLCGSNPIAIIIPCHRVLGADTLGGFSAPGGVDTKVALLKHEGAAGLLI